MGQQLLHEVDMNTSSAFFHHTVLFVWYYNQPPNFSCSPLYIEFLCPVVNTLFSRAEICDSFDDIFVALDFKYV